MFKSVTLRDMGMIVAMSAIVFLTYYTFILPFVFIVMILALKKEQSYMIAIVSSLLIFLAFMHHLGNLLNFIFLPLMVFILKSMQNNIESKRKKSVHDHSISWMDRLKFSAMSFVLIALSTIVAQIVYEVIVYDLLFAEVTTWFILTGSIVVNTVLVFLLAFPLQRRLCKILLYMKI